uniref:Autophagy-related protein 9 n=1 Tax=Nicotiana tabacum TaxID=4097 RepID=A0A1S4B6B4_TOBAC|nr:PREDICTED: autophagy-related protein 9-like isoform X2 [Nicotiana tabacum]
MMFSGQKGASGLNIFKWKWHGESSLRTGLLDDVPPEIELSDYRIAPSPGSESPSGLLNGESLNVEPIADLDLFFERLYNYYCEKGLWCIIIKWIFELLSLAFTICFSGFFLLYVDWNGLRNAKCGMDAVESGIKQCNLANEALHLHPLKPLTLFKAIVLGYLGIFSVYWIFCFLRFFAQLKETLAIRQFYYRSLHVTDNEIQTIPWASILERVVQLQELQQLCVVKNLSIHDVVMRLMRKENYLIGMLNKGLLAFPISHWVPGAGPTIKCGPNGVRSRLILTKTLEWTLNWCILQSMFDRNFCIRREFISDPKTLKKRLMIVGVLMLLLSPFLVIFMLVYLFLRHAEQFYNHPSTASSRRWSNLAKWMFREFNEVDHLFKHRITSSVIHASDYLKQFPSPIISIVAKFISFVSGGFAAVLIIIAFLEESLLEGHIFGRNLFWERCHLLSNIHTICQRDGEGKKILRLHELSLKLYFRCFCPTDTYKQINYTGMMLLEEMASIFLTPYLLLFVVPKRVDDILHFIVDFTVHVEGVGHVCSFSVFDFQNHGNSKYGAPYNSARVQRSSQGKMEKSFLSFLNSYPSWEPDDQGKQFLSTLKTFREQKLQVQDIIPVYRPSELQHWNPNFRGSSDRNNLFSREVPLNNLGAGFGSMWLIDGGQRYIIDWYYTSHPHNTSSDSRGIESRPSHSDNERLKDPWMPSHFVQIKDTVDNNWEHLFEDRSQSHLEATTSAPVLRESILHHDDSSSMAQSIRSQWWDRTRLQVADPQTSFLEPPNFNSNRHDYYDNFSDRSLDEHEHVNLKNSNRLANTFFMDDSVGDFNLPFDGIYRRPSENPTRELDPSDLV